MRWEQISKHRIRIARPHILVLHNVGIQPGSTSADDKSWSWQTLE
jgi:hypothetical protein